MRTQFRALDSGGLSPRCATACPSGSVSGSISASGCHIIRSGSPRAKRYMGLYVKLIGAVDVFPLASLTVNMSLYNPGPTTN
jgi:hypothetical protein